MGLSPECPVATGAGRPWWYPFRLRRDHVAEKPEEYARAEIDRLLIAIGKA